MSNHDKDSRPIRKERFSVKLAVRPTAKQPYQVKLEKVPTRGRNKDRTARELRLALARLKAAEIRVSVVAVAEAVGVHPSLVHHVYPDIAKEISDLRRGPGPGKEETEKSKLAKAMHDLAALRTKLAESEESIKTLISRNATLDSRIRSLEAEKKAVGAAKVLPLSTRMKGKPV